MTAGGAPTLVVANIGQLVTGDRRLPPPGVIEDAILAAAGERVVYAGPASGFESLPGDGAVELDARGAAVVPGFVDAHTHLVWLGERSGEYALRAAGASYEEIAAAGGGIRSTVAATAAGSLDALAAGARQRARRMLRLGTTTVEVKSGYGQELEVELRQLQAARALRGEPGLPDVLTTYLPLHGSITGDREAYVEDVVERGLAAARPLANFVDCFCDLGAWSVSECRRLLEAARAAGLRAKLHAEQRSRTGAALLAAAVGAVSADHLEHASDDDLRALAAAHVTGVILPGASLVLGGPPPPGRRLLEAGATVAIATDCNPGTCWSESMPLMVSLAVALGGLTPAQALQAATSGGADALGLGDRGRLVPGLRCDALVLETPRWLDVAYHLGANPVAQVIARGVVQPLD
ncbi:MAG TPA: imidazolonepropionase [Candidatus Binatia bacterium]|nr:imidazolonepropionase [Candidatus Binatia bacterium]